MSSMQTSLSRGSHATSIRQLNTQRTQKHSQMGLTGMRPIDPKQGNSSAKALTRKSSTGE